MKLVVVRKIIHWVSNIAGIKAYTKSIVYPTLTRYSINTSSTYHRLIIIVSLHVPSSVLFDPAIAPWSSAVQPLHRRYRIVDDAIVNYPNSLPKNKVRFLLLLNLNVTNSYDWMNLILIYLNQLNNIFELFCVSILKSGPPSLILQLSFRQCKTDPVCVTFCTYEPTNINGSNCPRRK